MGYNYPFTVLQSKTEAKIAEKEKQTRSLKTKINRARGYIDGLRWVLNEMKSDAQIETPPRSFGSEH